MSFPDPYWVMPTGPDEAGGLEGGDSGASPDFPFGRRVLITEDNWLIASEWESALREAGYIVVGTAVSADEALAMGLEEAPDFVLMDIRLLGDRDGIDAALELRSRLGAPSIFVSAHDDAGVRARAAAAQPLGWISKPVLASRLAELIRQIAVSRS